MMRPLRFSTPLGTTRRSLAPLSDTTHYTWSSLSASTYQDDDDDDDEPTEGWWSRFSSALSQTANSQRIRKSTDFLTNESERRLVQLRTLLRVGIPSVIAGIVATLLFPAISLALAGQVAESGAVSSGALAVLAQDSSQFVQNFQTVASLLFSILVGQTCEVIVIVVVVVVVEMSVRNEASLTFNYSFIQTVTFLYTQQESIYYALFNEVTEAKSLLEQVALVCQGRSMYQRCLDSISRYVKDDLKKIQSDPAVLLSARPVDDPLEAIMYMTSVGVPSSVYETVKSLREARADRLGALQRKLPTVHMALLWILAWTLMCSFPLLGAGTQTVGGYKVLTVEGVLFGVMSAGIVLTMRVVGELWRPAGGAYNVDSVLSVMVSGLEDELKARQRGHLSNETASSSRMAPSGVREVDITTSRSNIERKDDKDRTIQQQGANIGIPLVRLYQWIKQRRERDSSQR